MGCVGSPTDVHRGKRRAVAPPGRGLSVGRGVALPLSVPLPSLGRQQSGRHCVALSMGGVAPHTTPVRVHPASPGTICAASRWQAWARLFLAAPVWAVGRSGGAGRTPAPPLGPGGFLPLASGGVSRCGLPALVPGGGLRYSFLALPSGARVRSGLRCRPRGGGVRGRPVPLPWGPRLTCKPPSVPSEWAVVTGGSCGRGLLRVPLCACSGTPVWVRGGRSSRRCPYRVAVPPVGGGAPRPWGGGGPRLWLPSWGGCGGGGGGGPPRSLSGLCGRGGGGEWGGVLRFPGDAPCRPERGGGRAAWRSQPRGPAIGQGVAPFPRPPLPSARSPRSPSLGPLISRPLPRGAGRPGVVVRVGGQWLAGCGAAFPG